MKIILLLCLIYYIIYFYKKKKKKIKLKSRMGNSKLVMDGWMDVGKIRSHHNSNSSRASIFFNLALMLCC